MITGLKPRAEAEMDNFALDPYCRLYLPLWKLDGDSFMSRDAYGHLCTRYGAGGAPAHWTPQGWVFDGVDDYVNCGMDIQPISAISVESWLKLEAFPANGSAISSGRGGGILLSYPDPPIDAFYVYTTGWNRVSIPQADIALDEWHHFVMTYDQTNLKIFMDDAEKDSMPLSGDITYDGTAFILGGYLSALPPYTPDVFFQGLIGLVLIYSRALTPQEDQYHYIVGKEMFG